MDIIQIRQFEYVREIARQGSIKRAADKLYISQQALSEMLKVLEEELGFQLFQRTNKGVVPTASGEKVLQDMDDIVGRIYNWSRYKEKTEANLILQYLIGDLLLDDNFTKLLHVPQIKLQFETACTKDMLEQVAQGEPCLTMFFVSVPSREYQQMQRLLSSQKYKMDLLASGDSTTLCLLMQKEEQMREQGEILSLKELTGKTLKVNKDMAVIDSMQTLQAETDLQIEGLPRSVKPIDLVASQKNAITFLPRFIAKNNLYVKNGAITVRRLPPNLEEVWCCYLLYSLEWETVLQDLIQQIKSYFSEQ